MSLNNSSEQFIKLPQSPNKTRQSDPQQSTNLNKKYQQTLGIAISTVCLLLYFGIMLWAPVGKSGEYVVAIVGTNDLHGQAYPTILYGSAGVEGYQYGGLVYLASMIKNLREEYHGNLLYLDGGDQFQGGVEASKLVSSGEIINDYFKEAGLNASSIGNHEFDIDHKFLIDFFNGRNSTNLAANMLSEKGEFQFFPHHKRSKLFTMPNGIKIGVIGLSTIETPSTTGGFMRKQFPQYKFLQYDDIVIEQSKELRTRGANAVLIVSHVGDACPQNLEFSFHNLQSKKQECPPDQVSRLIDRLPKGVVDGIVQGHRHQMSHRFYKNVPVIGSISGGYYFNIMYLKFDSNQQLIGSMIEGPVPVCQKIFQKIGICKFLTQQQQKSAGNLISWKFHNKMVEADPSLSQTYQKKYSKKMQKYNQFLISSQILLQRQSNKQCQLSNLFTNLLSQSVRDHNPDFAFLNTGLFRSEWKPGSILEQHYYNMFPFDNTIQVFQITGRDLVDTMKIVQKGRRVIQAWNLKMVIGVSKENGNGNGKEEERTVLELEDIRFYNGSAIVPEKVYKGVTCSYLLEGGDGFSKVYGNQFKPMNIVTIGGFRDVLRPYLKKMGIIKKNTLIDPKNPRLVVIQK